MYVGNIGKKPRSAVSAGSAALIRTLAWGEAGAVAHRAEKIVNQFIEW
jgi:hypothetical protein